MYNKVILLGRVAADLALKTTGSGTSVLSFPIACERRYQERGKERVKDFFNCVAWRGEAEFISKFWSKGDAILIEGELQNRSYVDKNNITRYVTEVIVERASFTGGKNAERQTSAPAPSAPPKQEKAYNSSAPYGIDLTAEDFIVKGEEDEEYPFETE